MHSSGCSSPILARKGGKWTGGHLPLGYDLVDGCLVVNEEEAARVLQVFDWYMEGHSVHGIVAKCEDLQWRNKQWATKEGKMFGGHAQQRTHERQMEVRAPNAG